MKRALNLPRLAKFFLISMVAASAVATVVLSVRAEHGPKAKAGQLHQTYFYKARVTEITDEGTRSIGVGQESYQKVLVHIEQDDTNGEGGDYLDKTIPIEVTGFSDSRPYLRVNPGDKIVVMHAQDSDTFFVANKLRLNGLWLLVAAFVAIVLAFAGKKGLFSIVGLVVTILVLTFYSVPSLLSGSSPLLITLISSTIILSLALPLAHGFNLRTAISLISSLAALALAGLLAVLAVNGLQLFGMGSEESVYLQFLGDAAVDTRGILLGGIIIGTLGVIDDIVASQVAIVAELRKANPSLTRGSLFRRGLRVGREHIASLVNTLVLAYTGASLPLLLLFSYYQNQPLWTILNSDMVAEEITRTLIGSMTLVVAVPIATFLAALILVRVPISGDRATAKS